MREAEYQTKLIKELKHRLPGCVVLKNDASYIQGFPDLTIFHQDRWAVLEVKATMNSSRQPNQNYYVGTLNEWSFAAFICPENEEEVLGALERSFKVRRSSRVSKSK